MPKQIGIFSLAYPPFVGGAEIAVKEIIGRLPGFNFRIFTHDFNKYGSGKWAKFWYILRAWRAAEKAHKKNKFDVIWAVMAAYAGIAALLFKLRHPSVPLLLTLQEGDSEKHILRRVGIFYPLWKMIFKKADRIQVISHYLADFARRHGARCPIEVVPNGVDITRIMNHESGIRNESEKEKIIITTSRLVYKNGIDTLIRAMAVIASEAKQSDIKLQILGSGPDEQKLENLATELGVADRIEFLGHVEPEKIPGYLARADIFVRASRSEGLGNSFLEAMAAGLPVIGTNVGGIPDFLVSLSLRGSDSDRGNLANGLFVEVDSPRDLAEKITLLLRDEKLRKKLGENGRKLVLANYSWDLISQKMDKIFRSLIHDSKFIIRVLVATGIYPPDIGGPATYTVLLENELPARGFKVGVLAFTKYRSMPKIIRHLAYFWKCLWLLRRHDMVYAQDPVSVGLPSMLAARILRKPFIIRIAGDYAWEQAAQRFGIKDSIDDFSRYARSPEGRQKYPWQVRLMLRVQKFVANHAKIIITPSKYFQKLVSGWVKNPEKAKAIYNGIDLGNQELGIRNYENKEKFILSAGRLVPWKGFDVLIEIMKDLPDWKLVIVGDGPEREKLELRIKNYELGDRVTLAGSLSREKLMDLLRKASVFVLNTAFESFSFQVVEAMNAGTPVVTTNIGNLPEIIENNKEGILVQPNNKTEILAAIRRIASDKNFREEIVKNAKEKAKQFSIEKTVDQLEEILKNL